MVPFLCPELTAAYVPFIEDKLINMSSIDSMERKEETREDSSVVFTLESTTIFVDLVIK
jgi:hypothetical protein